MKDGTPDGWDEPLPLWQSWLVGLVLIIACELVVGLLGVYVSGALSVAAALILGLAIVTAGSARFGFEMVLAGVLAIAGGFGAAYFFLEVHELAAGPIVRDLRVEEAPRHPLAKVLVLVDGEHRPKEFGVHVVVSRDRDGGKKKMVYVAYPVVPPGWSREDPVPLWAAETGDIPDAWTGYRTAVRVPPLYLENYQEAVREACESHGLTSAEGSFVARFAPSYEAAVAEASRMAWGFPALMAGLWLLGAPWFRSMVAEGEDGEDDAGQPSSPGRQR